MSFTMPKSGTNSLSAQNLGSKSQSSKHPMRKIRLSWGSKYGVPSKEGDEVGRVKKTQYGRYSGGYFPSILIKTSSKGNLAISGAS